MPDRTGASRAIPPWSGARTGRAWARALVVTGALLVLSARCDCIYPYFDECHGLDEAACVGRSAEGVTWTQAHCVVVRDGGRFVRCRPIPNTGCGF